MNYHGAPELPQAVIPAGRPFITSYDLGHEHSQEHYFELQCMVEDAEEQESGPGVPELEEVTW